MLNIPNIIKIDHIAIVVADIETGLNFWQDILGLQLSQIEDVPEQEARVAFLPVNDTKVELVQPTSQDSGLARYLEKRGPGMHHICFEVDDIEVALAHLKSQGTRLIDENPRTGSDGKLLAFIHPESTQGVLVELYELPNHNTN